MISNQSGQRLHDRATRGEALSDTERARLGEWLAAQDAAEVQLFSRRAEESSLTKLRSEISQVLEQVAAVTRRLQDLSSENDALRRETTALRSRLAAAAHPA